MDVGVDGMSAREFEAAHGVLDGSLLAQQSGGAEAPWWPRGRRRETPAQAWRRVEAVAAEILAEGAAAAEDGRHIHKIVVSHGDLIDKVLGSLLGMGRHSVAIAHDNTGASRVEVGRGGVVRLHTLNSPPAIEAMSSFELLADGTCERI